ncbi:uncharacterized protein LOC129565164 isoform X1 [Sitodiplosis mosellana]|uniref:uncharacterized protein LOC129565164 isoform X1 n=1 Tax=Sitodiplosis mosellana TaxID=263140 RepID=UPI002444DFEC|nr:uncharacterized protein LOC129565164 isoform X1 [Sitodiplosis mosellana]
MLVSICSLTTVDRASQERKKNIKMSKVLFTVLVVCFAQLAYGRVARQSVTTTETSVIDELFQGAKSLFDEVHNATLNLAGVKSDDEFWGKGKELFTKYQKSLESSVADLDANTKDLQGEAKDLVTAFNTKVTAIANDLKAKNPELFSGDVQKLQDIADKTLRTVVQEGQKLKTRLEAEGERIKPQVEATLKQITEAATKTATEFKANAETAINSISKKN